MRLSIAPLGLLLYSLFSPVTGILSPSTSGLEALVRRRLPDHVDKFTFSLSTGATSAPSSNGQPALDEYTVDNGNDGTIHVSGNSPIALATGLRWYLTNILHLDMYWFVGSRLHLAPSQLPKLQSPHHGASIVPWRYHFNTVTFSYTTAFWSWEDWEDQIDWLALHGVNLPLAWVGYEKVFSDTLVEAGFKQEDVLNFLSGPAFQAWNRFGNIQRSWGGKLSMSWLEDQQKLGQQIVARMAELGMTPVLPCFTGYVPSEIKDVHPNASFVVGNSWAFFKPQYSNDTFLEPFDPLFTTLQKSFIGKLKEVHGDVSHIYTLDQYNEIAPLSGDPEFLTNTTSATIKAMKAADPDAIWMMQGWLFYEQAEFWTQERIKAYLGGVNDTDMIILDLFADSQPLWKQTNSYYGKPWIFCEVHGFGGNMGLYGQIQNITINPVEAFEASGSMVGMGSAMEGHEGNEVIYAAMLDQGWSKTPLNATDYFHDWAAARYSSGHCASASKGLYNAWNILRHSVYDNTNVKEAAAVPISVLTRNPLEKGILTARGSFGTWVPFPEEVSKAWTQFYGAVVHQPSLWDNAVYRFDLTDFTRQVLSNGFTARYIEFLAALNASDTASARQAGHDMLAILSNLDDVLAADGNNHFSLPSWIASARSLAPDSATADFYEYDARNQITLWGPDGQISDYAAKLWGGLVRSYYMPRWQTFVTYTLDGAPSGSNKTLQDVLSDFQFSWQNQIWGQRPNESFTPPPISEYRPTIERVVRSWPNLFTTE